MRAIAGGVSAGSSLAIAHRLLAFLETPPYDLVTACNHSGELKWDGVSFCCGLACGVVLVLLIQTFITLRWAFITFVQLHFGGGFESRQGVATGKQLYKLL